MTVWNSITVSAIKGVLNIPSEKGRYVKIDRRPWYGLTFCRNDGRISYRQNGNTYVSDCHSAVLLPQGQSYELTGDADGEFPLINFHCAYSLGVENILVCPLQASEPFIRDFDRMHALWVQGPKEAHADLFRLFYSIISRLAEQSTAQEIPTLLHPAIEYLSQHIYHPDLTVAALADSANLSETYFRRLFHRSYGVSPKQYILDLRIRQAKQLLFERSSSVSVIAEQCGFASVYHFSRAFKAAVGVAPTQYLHVSRP